MSPSYLSSIHHDGSIRYVLHPKSQELKIGNEVTIRLRTAPDALIQRLLLRTCPDVGQFFTEMHPADSQPNPACCWWEATLRLYRGAELGERKYFLPDLPGSFRRW